MDIDRSKGMVQICNELENKNIDISKLNAIDIFARKGNWQTFVYANKVKSLEAWEIDKEFESDLKNNLPNAKIRIIDSINEIKKSKPENYDFIVIDNPQNTFGKNNEYCEHFDVLLHINNLINDKAIIIFNVNKEPFNIETSPDWEKRRSGFYKAKNSNNLSLTFLTDFYKRLFLNLNLNTIFNFHVFREECKPLDYLYYFVFYLEKNDIKL